MEQRTYHSGNIAPQDLADFLVGYFDPQKDLQAQQIGQMGTHLVQIGRGDVPKELRHAVTVAISSTEDGTGVKVALGQQQWLTPQTATFAAAMGLLGVLVTPFALFALLWPLSDALGSTMLPSEIWEAINTYMAGNGGGLTSTEELNHPHAPTAF